MFETWHVITGSSILTDDIFTAYGGQTGSSTAAQRGAAYVIAEQFAVQEIGTFLTPTTVTGTFPWPIMATYPTYDFRFKLPHDRVWSILSVTTIHDAGCDCADDAYELTGCAWILDGDGGVLDLRECGNTVKAACASCTCGHSGTDPLQVRVVYSAGIPAGLVASSPTALMGLVTAADLALEQIIDPSCAEGGPGDPGLEAFSDTGYSERRFGLARTAFGNSPRGNYAARMLSPFKYKGALKL
jgi:hypothetical protein